ncbi:MAG: hypothetical protein GY710_06255 [Desulfobacteraceae bacterium]|nr:hypothetical protein [Desulfobacteraceae bacterium]
MPALNFKKEFAAVVKMGKKNQTIRALRKDGRNPKPGQTLFLYTGMRTKSCLKLKEVECKSVEQIYIHEDFNISLASKDLSYTESLGLVKKDGFKNIGDFMEFFRKTHGLPFNGLLIKW